MPPLKKGITNKQLGNRRSIERTFTREYLKHSKQITAIEITKEVLWRNELVT